MQHIAISNDKGDRIELEQVVAFLQERFNEHDHKSFPGLMRDGQYEIVTAEPGKKYIKIVGSKKTGGPQHDRQASVYCFLDYQGNIYKAASWKAPAKHVRGSIFDTNMSWGKALGRYGAVYLR